MRNPGEPSAVWVGYAVIPLDHWYLLPVGVGLAGVATSAGISGSNFWLPLFLLGLSLPPRLAFWMALATMVFGAGSGVVRNLRAGTIDGALARRLLLFAVPATAVGAWLSTRLDPRPLLLLFAGIATLAAVALLRTPKSDATTEDESRGPVSIAAGFGGLLQGVVATGCGTLVLPALLRRSRAHHASLVGTTVLVVFVCALVAAAARLNGEMVTALGEHRDALLGMLSFAAPGVILGGQLGPRVAQRLPRVVLRRYVAGLLLLVAAFVAVRAF